MTGTGDAAARRPRVWWAVVALLAVFVLDLVLPAVVLVPFYFVIVVGMAIWVRTRTVVGLAAFAFALALVAGAVNGDIRTDDYWVRLAAMAAFVGIALFVARTARARERRLAAASRLMAEVVNGTDQPMFAKDYSGSSAYGEYVFANDAWAHSAAVDPAAAAGLTDGDVFPPDITAALLDVDETVVSTGQRVRVEEVVGSGDDVLRTYLVDKFPLTDDTGAVWGVGGIATDITGVKRNEQRLSAVFARSPIPTVRILVGASPLPQVVDANEAMRRLVGRELVGIGAEDGAHLVHADDLELVRSLIAQAATESLDAPSVGREVRLSDRAGREVWASLSVAAVSGADRRGHQELILQFDDVTARKQAEAELSVRALTDPVTGLPNRFAFNDRLSTALSRLARHPGTVCLLFCDLDRFKEVNDIFGHEVGDTMLQEVARRLMIAVRPDDTVARLGGDEFVVLCEGMVDPTDAVGLAERVLDHVREPWVFEDHRFSPSTSIGIAVTSDPDASGTELLRRADLAMYRAKDSGRDRVHSYELSLDEVLATAVAVQQRVHAALEEDGLELHYQPIVRTADRTVVGVEALVRLPDGSGGYVPPDVFLPRAEASGLIAAVDSWVQRRAFTDLARWRADGRDLTMSVNCSPSELRDPLFADALLSRATEAGVEPAWVVIEVTETVLLQDDDAVLATLSRLHGTGMRIALDDFGTGFSSLAWLHQFPVDVVKVDRSFVRDLETDPRRRAVVAGLMSIAAETDLVVVAEGVETEEQRELLVELGCHRAQGWLFGRPVPFDHPSWESAGLSAAT